MKTLLHASLIAMLVLITSSLTAQSYEKGRVLLVTKNMTISGDNFPDQCDACVINIVNGATLTFNKDVSIPGVVISGGNIVINSKVSSWGSGVYNNVNITLNTNGSFASSATLVLNSSQFTFTGNSTGSLWAKVDFNNTKMTFLGNSSIEVTNTLNLMGNSSLTAGDETKESKAFINFNGGKLNEFDNAYVSLMGLNNYYNNWDPYKANGKSIVTKNNKLNCDAAGKNACNVPFVYGPATLSYGGVISTASLPVKLSAFEVKLTGSKVDIAWVSDMELDFDRYEIERSIDGVNWSIAGTVKSTGNANIVSRYSFTDALKVSGTVSYRLKMIDIDGSFTYSPIKVVKSASVATEMTIFPNPATTYFAIDSKSNALEMNIQVISQSGQILKQVNARGKATVAVNEFNPGNYIVRVTNENGVSQSFKLMIKR